MLDTENYYIILINLVQYRPLLISKKILNSPPQAIYTLFHPVLFWS